MHYPGTPPKRRRVGPWFAIGIPVIIVATLIAADVADHAAGCGSIDPTDPANYSSVLIRNDTNTPVNIRDCQGAYCNPEGTVSLKPGSNLTVDAACGAAGPDMTSYHVTSGEGRDLGYIAVDTPHSYDSLVYEVSRARARRDAPTPPS